jgi:exosome complex component MTR3
MIKFLSGFFQAIVGDDIQLDPSEAEARASSGTLILACMPALDSITSIWQSGQMSADLSLKVIFSG